MASAARQREIYDTIFGGRLAPNGRLVRENFEDWFGASVTVDDVGLPRVFFHGTQIDFTAFKPGAHGMFFAEQASIAEPYSRLCLKKGTGLIMPVYLSIKRPWQLISYADDFPYSQMVDQSTETLIGMGYDGMFRPGDKVWIAFSPLQVKSAIGNSGIFDPLSDDMADIHGWDAAVERPRMRA